MVGVGILKFHGKMRNNMNKIDQQFKELNDRLDVIASIQIVVFAIVILNMIFTIAGFNQ